MDEEESSNINWLDSKFIGVHDKEGNELKIECGCGKPAVFIGQGEGFYQGWCEDCYKKETKK